MNKLPKILIGAPTADVKSYCADDWYENVKQFIYPEFDIFLADNSLGNENIDFWTKKGVEIKSANNRKQDSVIKRLTDSHNLVREKAIKEDYDYLLHLEVDVFPPPEILICLLSHKLPLVSVSYDIYDGEDREPLVMRIDNSYDGEDGAIVKGQYSQTWFDGNLKQAWSNGVGCCLIHRSVLEQIPFRYVPNNNAFPDSWFSFDCAAKNIPHYVDTSMYALHRNMDWRKYGDKFTEKIFDK